MALRQRDESRESWGASSSPRPARRVSAGHRIPRTGKK